jgi:hypothetical protein
MRTNAITLRSRSSDGGLLPDELEHEVLLDAPYRETLSPVLPLAGFLGLDAQGIQAPSWHGGQPIARPCIGERRAA